MNSTGLPDAAGTTGKKRHVRWDLLAGGQAEQWKPRSGWALRERGNGFAYGAIPRCKGDLVKKTWRLASLMAEAKDVMPTARSLSDAAERLGVDKSTVFRWVKSKKIPPPGRRAVGPPAVPEGWAAAVRATYDLDATEAQLLVLAEEALALALDKSLRPADRLSAMTRFARLVRELDLEPPDGQVETPNVRGPWPRAAG